MRIAMVSEHASPLSALGGVDAGGQNLHVCELSTGLARSGHQVTVYTRRDSTDLPDRVGSARGFDVVHIPAGPPRPLPKDMLLPYMDAFGDCLIDEWRTAPPDVVHAHFWMSGLASMRATRTVGLPVVQTFHALGVVKRRHQRDQDTSPPERIERERELGRQVAKVAATCSDEVFELVTMGIPRSSIGVVPCGVDLHRFVPLGVAARRGAKHRVVSVGRLVPRKGFDLLISALTGVPDTELVIAGGPERDQLVDDQEAIRLRGIAAALGVSDRVRMVGRVSRTDMPALLRSADVVAATPWYEPFGLVPLEAMASGVPVIATAVGGLTDTVVDGVTGIHVPPRRVDALRRALQSLLGSPALRQTLGAAGRQRAVQRYSWERVVAETVRLYQRAGNRRPRGTVRGETACGRLS